jgi:primosomal protein N''
MSDSPIEREIKRIVEPIVEQVARSIVEGQRAPQREWLTERELAELWGCSPDTIRAYAFRKENPLPYGTVGEMRRYHRADFDAWARSEGERDRQRRLAAKGEAAASQPTKLAAVT